MEKININDRIKIINPGQIYPTYEDMAKKLKATKWKPIDYIFKNEEEYRNIKGIVKNFLEDYYLIDIGDEEIIIDRTGIKLLLSKPKIYGIAKFFMEIDKR